MGQYNVKFKQFLLSKNRSYAMLLKHFNLHLGKSKSEAVRHIRDQILNLKKES